MDEIRNKLKCSLEAAHIRSALALTTFLVVAYVTLMTFFWSGITFTLVLCGLILIPIWCYYGLRYHRIFRKMEHYTFQKVLLSQPHASRWFHVFSFIIVLTDADGEPLVTSTSAIFLAHGWLGPILEDYVNREVRIAYNPVTRVVVVLG